MKAVVLILGTMPGSESLRQRQYYAHGPNAFWKIMAVLGIEGESYEQRCMRLTKAGIALWDVVESCERTGSLDSKIRNPRPNDIGAFVDRHPELRLVIFNGKKAEDLFSKLCDTLASNVDAVRMPSTSPANARKGKVGEWVGFLRPLVGS